MEFTVMTIEQTRTLPGVLLWNVSKLWQQQLNSALEEIGLSSTNAVILSNMLHLELEHQQANQGMLAELSNVDLMTTSNALRTLQKKGFIDRNTDPHDKRAYILSLTTEGRHTAYQALRRIAHCHQHFFGRLQDQELAQFAGSLTKLLGTLKPDDSTSHDRTDGGSLG